MKNAAAGVVLVLLTIASAGAQPPLPVVTVHVEIFGAFGERYPGTQVLDLRLLTEDRKREYRGLALDGTIKRVPYGNYILVASSRGGGAAERKITVNTPDPLVRLGLSFPKGNTLWPGGDLEISGRLEPAPENPKDWWVRAEGVFLHVSREAPILESGAFAIGGLEMGAYLVTAFEGKTLRYAGTIEIDPKEPKTKLTVPVPARGR